MRGVGETLHTPGKRQFVGLGCSGGCQHPALLAKQCRELATTLGEEVESDVGTARLAALVRWIASSTLGEISS